MSSAAQTKDITSHMVAFIKTHGGLDLAEFYEEHAESEVTDIIVEYTKMLLAAIKDDDNKSKLEDLAKKLTPTKSSRKKKDPDAPKRGKSAYIFFGQEYREKAKEELMEEPVEVAKWAEPTGVAAVAEATEPAPARAVTQDFARRACVIFGQGM